EHVPGAGWTNYVYDRLDRVVLTQTAQQTSETKWSYIKYDPLGRVVETGDLVSPLTHGQSQAAFDTISNAYEYWQTGSNTYTNRSFPSILRPLLKIKTQNIYDTYPSIVTNIAYDGTHAFNQSKHSSAKGL